MNLDNYTKEEKEDGRIIFTPKKKDWDWEPGDGVEYFFVDADGRENNRSAPGFNRLYEELLLKHHNVFQTKEQAQKASKLQRVSNAIIRACLLVDPDYEPDWSSNETKHRVFFSSHQGWTLDRSWKDNKSPAYVSTTENANQVCVLLAKWRIK